MASQDRTEKPTGKRLEEARGRGQVPRSRDVVQVAAFAASLAALGRWGGQILSNLTGELRQTLNHLGDAPLKMLIPSDVAGLAMHAGMVLATSVGPIAGAAVIGAVGISVLQTKGLLISSEQITINFARLNPAAGLKRFWSVGYYELLK